MSSTEKPLNALLSFNMGMLHPRKLYPKDETPGPDPTKPASFFFSTTCERQRNGSAIRAQTTPTDASLRGRGQVAFFGMQLVCFHKSPMYDASARNFLKQVLV